LQIPALDFAFRIVPQVDTLKVQAKFASQTVYVQPVVVLLLTMSTSMMELLQEAVKTSAQRILLHMDLQLHHFGNASQSVQQVGILLWKTRRRILNVLTPVQQAPGRMKISTNVSPPVQTVTTNSTTI
jgi:hypothetical protein